MDDSVGTFLSRLVRATRYSASLRTTVPQVVAELLELGPGDSLVWSVDPGGTQVRVVRGPRRGSDGGPETSGAPALAPPLARGSAARPAG
jgi:hypothetical protein